MKKEEPAKKLKGSEVEITVCPKCRKPLLYIKYSNTFVCTDCNYECRINY